MKLYFSPGVCSLSPHIVTRELGLNVEIERVDLATKKTQSGVDFNTSMIFGGQIKGEAMRMFLVYSAGNFIEATRETCFFQIGESKYGKPILDRVLTPITPLDEGCLELLAQRPLPLLAQVRWTQDRKALDLASVDQLSCYQTSLDGLSDTDVIGDEQPHRVLLKRHKERHKLIGTRFDCYAGQGAKRSCPSRSRPISRAAASRMAWSRSS